MATKSEFVQIRVTPLQKERLKRHAEAAGQDLSSYVLSRALPSVRLAFEELLRSLGEGGDHRFVLAELNDFLSGLPPAALGKAVEDADLSGLPPLLQNYVAAMVEQASHAKGVTAPPWTVRIRPLEEPYFGAPLKSLRLHLLEASPVPFKRRNIFVDAAVGDRV